MSNEAKKVVNTDELEYMEDIEAETIPVMRLSMEGYPDLILNSAKEIGDQLQWSFLGENNEWWDFKSGAKITITFESMPKAEFDALEEWGNLV